MQSFDSRGGFLYNQSMKKIFLISFLVLIVVTGAIIAAVVIFKPTEKFYLDAKVPVGAWLWKDEDLDAKLDFALKNGVDEIYFCDYSLDDGTAAFVKKANSNGIKVYALLGEKEWVKTENSAAGLEALLEKYNLYQSLHSDAKLTGVHLDIEPHQFGDFDENANFYLTNLVTLAYNLKTNNPGIKFDYDIPAWLDKAADDENFEVYQVNLNGSKKAAYKHLIDIADRVFVMSYRDTAAAAVSFAENELLYAKEKGKQIAVCFETGETTEGDNVSFFEEGKRALCEEVSKLDTLLEQDFMVSIHSLERWKNLKEK